MKVSRVHVVLGTGDGAHTGVRRVHDLAPDCLAVTRSCATPGQPKRSQLRGCLHIDVRARFLFRVFCVTANSH